MRTLMLAALLSACSWRTADRVTLGASYATMTCDYLQTRSAASAGWMDKNGKQIYEKNVFMGPSPSTKTVDTYFFSLAVAHTAIWLLLPEKTRSAWGGFIGASHARVIPGNAERVGVCGV